VSAPELTLARCRAEILEVAAFDTQPGELARRARDALWTLPPLGRALPHREGLALAVRPQRWLLLLPAGAAAGGSTGDASGASDTRIATWQRRCAGSGAVVELSAGLTALWLTGPAVREALRRGCRLDLEPAAFPQGTAAATSIAQVAVTLAALRAGFLLLTPASTARHFEDWLAGAARAFGMSRAADVTVAAICGDANEN
jgi:heterotetrameric sarcosine oxidase gamma subunit